MPDVDIVQARLYNQGINAGRFHEPAEVVAWLGAVQAQDYAGAKWALGLRLPGSSDDDIEQAFNDGSILRTHVLRPTWHFVTPADIRWMLALTAPRVHQANGTMYRRLDVDAETTAHSDAVLAAALSGGRQLIREELRDALQDAGIDTSVDLRLIYLLMHAELEGIICSGPRRGKQFTYALLAERAPQARVLDREEALAELARRFFQSRGPATVHDFAKWSGLTVTDARRGLAAVSAQFQQKTIHGRDFWFPAPSTPPEAKTPTAHLLSIYDEYHSGYKDRSDMVTDEHRDRLMAMGNALTYSLVIDGIIVGTWRRTLGKRVTIELNPFRPLTAAEEQAVIATVEHYGRFLGLPVDLSIDSSQP